VKYSSNPSATPDIAEWTMEISSSWIKSKTYSETITGLKPRTTYYFWIRARDENATNWSVWSDTKSAVASSFIYSGQTAGAENTTAIAWGDYDNDGDLDIVVGNYSQNNPIYRNNGDGTFSDTGQTAGAENTTAIAWGDYDNDGDLDIVVGDYGGNNLIYKSLEADFGNANSSPTAPSSGFSSHYSSTTGKLELRWADGTDTNPGATSAKGLYYNIRIATEPISDNLKKWIISPSTGAGVGSMDDHTFGNYPHGFCVASSTQPGFNLKLKIENTTYYWQVRTIDTGLRSSSWSTQQSTYVPNEPPTVPDLISPINGTTTNQVTLTFDWSDSTDTISGVSNYELQLATSTDFTTVSYSSAPTISQCLNLSISESLYW